MKKTLFVQIDNTPAPVEAENDYIPLECKQINDFCSFVGDALIGDLKDSNGTPLYRFINPAGRLLSDFGKVDKSNYDLIIAQWLNILGEILHKGVTQCDEQFIIRFPQQFTDWLLCNQNDYYVEIGKSLQANDGEISLDVEGISEDIISAMYMKITRFLSDKSDEIEYIVFSNERIGNSSYGVKQLRTVFDSYSFLRLEQWNNIINEEIQRRFMALEDYRAFRIDDFILGVTKIDELENVGRDGLGRYRECFMWFKGGVWQKLYVTRYEDSFEHFLSIVLRGVTDYELTYNSLRWHLKNKGFYVLENPHYHEDYFVAKIRKETNEYWCNLEFFFSPCSSLSSTAELKGTLYAISIEVK